MFVVFPVENVTKTRKIKGRYKRLKGFENIHGMYLYLSIYGLLIEEQAGSPSNPNKQFNFFLPSRGLR